MASSLIANSNSESQHQANLLANTPGRVKVMVEDELDVVVWHRILSVCAPHIDFEVRPYSYDSTTHGKGKAQIMANAGQFGHYFIGCVDSDNDWLLQRYTDDGQIISSSPYIFQTYAYSIENLAAQPGGMADCMLECGLHCCDYQRNLDNDFQSFLALLSPAVYEVLLWHLTLKEDGIDLDSWDYIFGNGHYEDIHNDSSLSIEAKRETTLARLAVRANELVTQYTSRYPALESEKERLSVEISSDFGLSPDNAYLFVRGHNLHNFLMHNFFNPVSSEIRRRHEADVRAHTVGPDTANAIKHYNKLRKDFGRDYIHRISFIKDADNPIAARIRQDINAVYN